jgi:Protein of unknown function (DUF3108)
VKTGLLGKRQHGKKARPARAIRGILAIALLAGITNYLAAASAPAPNWQSGLTKDPPGNFPPPRSFRANYVFGWAGLTAAVAEVKFGQNSPDGLQIQGTGRTTGLARALWRYDVNYRAGANASTLRPIESNQAEMMRSKKINTHLAFTNSGVSRTRTEGPGPGTSKIKEFAFPNLFDLHSALLYLRSQPLKDHTVQRVVVYPATSAYLVTTTVLGREKISVRAGTYSAIKIDLQLKKIGKDFDLQPHKKFRRATVWVSDDRDRLILRIEAQIFVGTIFAELQSINFEES